MADLITRSRRSVGLDALRLVAVFLVLGAHLKYVSQSSHWLLTTWHHGGYVGVDIFFVLSGFLVSGLLFEEYRLTGQIDSRRFIVRRLWRIYPAFFVLVIFTVALRMGWMDVSHWATTIKSTMAELTFVQNYFRGLSAHTWTIAVEMHFYVALAIFLGILARRKTINPFGLAPLLVIALAVACFGFRVATFKAAGSEPMNWFQNCGTHLRIDSLFFGVLIAYLYHFHNLQAQIQWVPTWVLVGVGVLGISPAFTENVWGTQAWAATVILFYLASGLLVLAATRLGDSSNRIMLAVASLGTASYSIYLWHIMVSHAMGKVFTAEYFWLYLATYVLGSLAVGWILWRVVEPASLALRDRWFPSRRDGNQKYAAEKCAIPEHLPATCQTVSQELP